MNQLQVVSPDGATTATFVPDANMVCCSLVHDGDERLDARKGLAAYAAQGSTMGIPLLYPWANRLGGYEYEAGERHVTLPEDAQLIHLDPNSLPIHGVEPGLMRWQPADQDDPTVLSARLDWSSDQLLALFPFVHEVVLEARASTGVVQVTTTVRARAGDLVPVSFGFHPYLLLPGGRREDWTMQLPRCQRLALDGRMLPTGELAAVPELIVPLAGQDFDDAYVMSEPAASFSVVGTAGRITVQLVEGFGFGQVYSPADAGFICFEPMTAPSNALRSGDGLRTLAPGEEHRAVFRIMLGEEV